MAAYLSVKSISLIPAVSILLFLTFLLPFLHNFFRILYASFRNCPQFAHIYVLYFIYQMKLMTYINKRAPLSASTNNNLTLLSYLHIYLAVPPPKMWHPMKHFINLLPQKRCRKAALSFHLFIYFSHEIRREKVILPSITTYSILVSDTIGLPSATTKSASLPTSNEPTRSSTPICFAA